MVRWTWTPSRSVPVWTTSRFQKNETGSYQNERIGCFAAEYSFVVLK